MYFIESFKEQVFRLNTKRNIVIASIITLILLIGVFKACSQDVFVRKHFYIIGRDNTWYPYHLRGKEYNLTGFTNDLMAAIAHETQLNFRLVDSSPSTILDGLDYERYDAIISTMPPNILNRNQYAFSNLFFELGLVLIVPQDSTATSLKDMQGKTLGISTSSYPIFKTIKEGGPHKYNIQVLTYDKINQALNSLSKGQLDGIVSHVIAAYALTKVYNEENLKIATPPLTDEGLRLVALLNDDSELLIKDFDHALKTLKENGIYAQLIKKWDLIDPSAQFIKK